MLRKIALITLLFLIYDNIFAQRLIESIDLVQTEDNIINIYQNRDTDEIFRHYSNRIDPAVLDLGIVNDLLSENVQEGIIWEKGKKIPFAKGEHFLATKNDFILTVKNSWDIEKETFSKEVRRYTIIHRSLLESEEKLQISKDHDIIMLENGNFIISNFSDDYGTEFKLYSNKMELLESYKPFMLGYNNIQFSEKNGILVSVIYPTRSNRGDRLKILYINTKNGFILREKDIHNNFSTENIFAINDLFILYGAGWINTFTTEGKLKWDKAFDEPVSIFEGDQGKYIYVVTTEKIYCLKKKNGSVKWSEKISKYYELNLGKMLESVVNIDVVPLGIYSLYNGAEIGVIIGQTKGTLGKSSLKHQIILFRLDKKGKLLGQVDVAVKSEIVKLISLNGNFKIITDDNVKTYSR
ncbi:MAG: hypothetical protein HOK80_10335 [Candidatus Cloacimonetes bacterium]|jgi:outer membrane protein assembly factor BamB|nr:hypothetical protein [Candidatus Cloacimonadota bacterium]MBT4331930.1 hypothetical protein [Candidatus Cloacimonadota bacterium]MBT4575478.1 hypothetical protein [Candidatus Cloacimonadota bacterium]MBT5421276.1 hypothetical protein [Candidatus Cloacimonadota bacterium]